MVKIFVGSEWLCSNSLAGIVGLDVLIGGIVTISHSSVASTGFGSNLRYNKGSAALQFNLNHQVLKKKLNLENKSGQFTFQMLFLNHHQFVVQDRFHVQDCLQNDRKSEMCQTEC